MCVCVCAQGCFRKFCVLVGFLIRVLIPQEVGFGNRSSVQKPDLDPLTNRFLSGLFVLRVSRV